MPYVAGAIGSGENNAFQADRSIFGVSNIEHAVLEGALTHWSDSNNPNGTDRTDADRPVDRVWDRSARVRTRPTAVAVPSYDLHINLTPGATDFDTFDFFMMPDHNLYELALIYGVDINCSLYIFDWNGAARSNEQRIARMNTTILSASPGPKVAWGLRYDADATTVNRRFTEVEHLRLNIALSAGNFSAIAGLPEIGEILCGRRTQMAFYPSKPLDDNGVFVSSVDSIEFPDGELHEVTDYRGRFEQRLRWTTSTQDPYNLNAVTQFRGWWQRTRQSTRPFAFCLQPWTVPTKSFFVKNRNKRFEQQIQAESRFKRYADTDLVELPPYWDRTVNG